MEEDMILPDGFDSTPTETEPLQDMQGMNDGFESEEQEPQSEPAESLDNSTQTTEPYKLKVKFNHQEMEIPEMDAIPLIQKGMNYDKTIEKLNQLQSDPRLSFVEELARDNGMTVDQYLDAVREQREQERINQLLQQNIPEEYAKEILENRKFREQLQAEQQQKAQQEQQQKDYQDFLNAFPDVKPDGIKPETWDKVNQGAPLKYAYMEQRMQELSDQIKILETNNQNKQKAPIKSAITSYGSEDTESEDDFLKGFMSV